ncbi:MAG: hypothetical protein MUP36_04660, partial [Demequinaceae bacterium]|nr:hypothetical protein [Demequinaceae bacterium]
FGAGGKMTTIFQPDNCSDEAHDVAVQGDGKIVAVGVAGCDSLQMALARYDDSGLDASFGTDGMVTTGFGPRCYDWASDVVIQPDGGIVVVGSTTCTDSFVLARYLAA